MSRNTVIVQGVRLHGEGIRGKVKYFFDNYEGKNAKFGNKLFNGN
jgi:hypothetical protein